MPALGLPLRTKGMVFRSTVLACLLYGCESTGFDNHEVRRYRVFMHSCLRSLCYDVETGTLAKMRGTATKVDLRHKMGLEDVEWYMSKAQLSYLGHVARYPDHRIEKLALDLAVCTTPAMELPDIRGKERL